MSAARMKTVRGGEIFQHNGERAASLENHTVYHGAARFALTGEIFLYEHNT